MAKNQKRNSSAIRADFSRVMVQVEFEGPGVPVDYRKDLGNTIRRNTGDIGLDEVAKTIYFSKGEVEIPSEYAGMILDIVRQNYIVPAQQALEQLLTPKK